jgi:hypothetical protein
MGPLKLRLVDKPGTATDTAPPVAIAATLTVRATGDDVYRLGVGTVVVAAGAVVVVLSIDEHPIRH